LKTYWGLTMAKARTMGDARAIAEEIWAHRFLEATGHERWVILQDMATDTLIVVNEHGQEMTVVSRFEIEDCRNEDDVARLINARLVVFSYLESRLLVVLAEAK